MALISDYLRLTSYSNTQVIAFPLICNYFGEHTFGFLNLILATAHIL